MSELVELINSVGFPIAMCIALFWMNNGSLKTQQQTLSEIKNVIASNTDAIDNLAETIKEKGHV